MNSLQRYKNRNMPKASKNKKPNPSRQKVGHEAASKPHPGPWGSVLWDHLEDIRKWRMKRTKWEDVVILLKERGVTITPAAVRNFFVRSRNPNLKLPDYLEHLRPPPSPKFSEPTTKQEAPAQPQQTMAPEPIEKTRSLTDPEPENYQNLFPN